jgi:hypothetical protein
MGIPLKGILSSSLLIVFFPAMLLAQGFNSSSGRNHPELKWMVAETENFLIMYPERISGIEILTAPIAEESYKALSANLNVEFENKIRIYLSDEDEINNGFAVPIGDGYTNIWVNLNTYAEIWTGSEKWLRKVVAHELAHIFHFEATRTNMGLWNYVIGNPTPSFWTEGLAQYQTEKWDSQRGDRWLRMAVFDDRINYNDGQSLYSGRLKYALGNSQLRYFSEAYGDSTLAKMLAERESFIFGLKYHEFNKAFREAAGKSYSEFNDEWRKHVNIYYNTLASQMERVDSLASKPESLPGQYYFDIKYSPDFSEIAVISIPSLQRPVRRLHLVQNDSVRSSKILAEGNVSADLAWSRDGTQIAYSRTVRGEHSSLVNDIHIINKESGKEERITNNRRAAYPAFSPDGDEIAYIVNNGGTANIHILNLADRSERQITNYTGDVQLIQLVWNHHRNELVFQRFNAEGNRHLVVLNVQSGADRILDDGMTDNRMPVISPAGSKIAFNSLMDEVPNVFIIDLDTDEIHRVTNLFTGGEVYSWIVEGDSVQTEKLAIKATETNRREHLYLVDAGRTADRDDAVIAEEYTTWRSHEPPNVIPWSIDPDASLIQNRGTYNSWKNITHTISLALPYYSDAGDFGIMGLTTWNEPLAKHLIAAGGNISITDPVNKSYGFFSYMNNQLYPSLTFNAYRTPGSPRFYGNRFLIEDLAGGDISAVWPLDIFEAPYRNGDFGLRLRYVSVTPYIFSEFGGNDLLPQPESAQQFDLRASWILKKQRPWSQNLIHPLDGYGARAMVTVSEKLLGGETAFVRPDLSAYTILPALGNQRIFVYGRAQAQFGDALPQDYIGFSRYDNIDLPLPSELYFLQQPEAERVRGHREFVSGKQVVFGSIEYRIPFLPSLNTSILGLVSLGRTSIALFADGGVVWDATFADGSTADSESRMGAGAELKNIIRVGPFTVVHALGMGWKSNELFTDDNDLYYRIRAVIPF